MIVKILVAVTRLSERCHPDDASAELSFSKIQMITEMRNASELP